MKTKIVGVFTGNRAEYGLLYPILRRLDKSQAIDLRLIVAGAHLESEYGNTMDEILQDGLEISATVRIPTIGSRSSETPLAIAAGIEGMVQVITKLRLDLLMVYADRFEGFAAVIAATQMNIPVAHLEGGDLTEGGALDDSVRHAMSKLAHVHFTTNQQATNRLLGMGEEPWRVHTTGLPALDGVVSGNYADPKEVISRLSIDVSLPVVLFTQHSITTQQDSAVVQIDKSLAALREFADGRVNIILTYPNNDAGGLKIIERLKVFEEDVKSPLVKVYPSLGRRTYHGVLGLSKQLGMKVVCVGNSSSGIKETPAFGIPTVNIGSRQKGRLRAENVIDVTNETREIQKAINICLTDNSFINKCKSVDNPYWHEMVGDKVTKVIEELTIDSRLLEKGMTLMGEVDNRGWFR